MFIDISFYFGQNCRTSWLHSGPDIQGCDALQCCVRVPMFQRTLLSLKLDAARSSGVLVSYHNHYLVSQTRRPWLESSLLCKPQISH